MVKKPPKAPKSRAAKRAATPPLDLGNIQRPPSPSQQQKAAVLGLRGDAGITKKSKKKKQLSAKQKQRKEKMMEKGEAVAEKLARKQDESKQKGRTVQTRRVCVLLVAFSW
jgi:hypothetical protein